MRIIELDQGTPEWLKWRGEKCTASDAPVIMGSAPHYADVKTWDDLRIIKAGLAANVEHSDFVKRMFANGHRREAIARQAIAGAEGFPVCVESRRDPRFAASLDSLNLEERRWAEIKAPQSQNSVTYQHTKEFGRPPGYILWQMVHQAGVLIDDGEVFGAKVTAGHFVVFMNERDYFDIRLPVEELLPLWPKLKSEWERFLDGGPQ